MTNRMDSPRYTPVRIILRNGNAWRADEVARALKVPVIDAQERLREMDEDGDVLMRNGWYTLSAAARARMAG